MLARHNDVEADMLRTMTIKLRLALAFGVMLLLMLVLGLGGRFATGAMYGAF